MTNILAKELIVDIGAHVGTDTENYLKLGYKVISFEANPDLVELNTNKFCKEIENGTLRIIPMGISDRYDNINFYINKSNDEFSSFDKTAGTRGGEYKIVPVQCCKLSDYRNDISNCHYMKIDIERSDIHVLNDLNKLTSLPKFVSVEAHKLEYLLILYNLGYRKFFLSDQKSHILQTFTYDGNKTKEFGKSSSGPFGDMITNWVDFEVVCEDFVLSKYQLKQYTDNASWYDFHATF